MISVMIIYDSIFFCSNIKKMLKSSDKFEFVGSTNNPKKVIEDIKAKKPDVIILDNNVGHVKGINLLKDIMAKEPCPLLFFSELGPDSFKECVASLKFGAVDFMIKPPRGTDIDWNLFKDDIFSKIKQASKVAIVKVDVENVKKVKKVCFWKKIVVIASSTGGVRTLSKIIPYLPEVINAPIVIIQHMPEGFTKELARILNKTSMIKVKEAEDDEELKNDVVYVAKAGYHLIFSRKSNNKIKIVFSDKPPILTLKPYANFTFLSAASIYKKNTIGIVLSGMGKDGTEGIKAIKEFEGTSIAQSEKDCILYGMPKSAKESGNIDHIVDLKDMAGKIVKLVNT